MTFVTEVETLLIQWRLALCVWLVLLIGMAGQSAVWAASAPLVLQNSLRGYSLVPQIEYIEDEARALDYDAANAAFLAGKGRRFSTDTINLGFSKNSFWFRFGLHNQGPRTRTVFIQIDYAILDRIDMYCGVADEKPVFYQLGDHVQFESRPMAVRNFAVPLEMLARQQLTCTLRVESSSNIALPITVSDVVPFVEDTRAGDWLLGWFYGLAFGMFIYNLLVYFASRERVYLLYVLHVVGGWGYNSALDGSFAMIWTLLDVQDAAVVFFVCLSLSAALQFALDFLRYKDGVRYKEGLRYDERARRMLLVGRGMHALVAMVLLLLVFAPIEFVTQFSVYVGLIVVAFVWLLGVLRIREGGRDVWAFVLGFGVVTVVALGALLASLGLDIPLFLTTYGMKLAWMFELAALSFALGLRIQTLKERQRDHELEMAETRAESRAKTEFLAKVSHEIRTPMNGILGLAELLGMTRLSAEQGRYVSAINSAGRALIDVVNDILDYTKLAAGKMTLNERFFDLRELVQDCAAIFEMNARKKNLELRIILRQGTPLRIMGDASRLRQVILNLLSNAMKYTESGHVFIRLSLTDEIRDERVVIKLAVEDTGIGIERVDQSRLFKSFSQIPSEVSEREPGTGLGLVISQQLIDLMGGKMGVESMVGHGSSFWFTLPVSLEDDFHYAEKDIAIDVYRPGMSPSEEVPASAPVQVLAPAPPPISVPTDSRPSAAEPATDLQVRVLLAEDNLINQKVILGFLDRLGIHPVVVENGRAALEKVMQAKVPYDLIFLDCQMPVMDGYEAARRIRQWESQMRCPATPIVALSAHHTEFHVQQSERAGMNLHLSKPISFKTLSEAVTHALGIGG